MEGSRGKDEGKPLKVDLVKRKTYICLVTDHIHTLIHLFKIQPHSGSWIYWFFDRNEKNKVKQPICKHALDMVDDKNQLFIPTMRFCMYCAVIQCDKTLLDLR